MEISFDHSYAGFFVLLSIFLAAGISYLLYFRNPENSSLTTVQKVFLVILRFLSLFLIFLFLLSPLMERTKKIKQLPILAVAFDNSQSVQPYSSELGHFEQSLKDRFAGDYQLEFWSFGEKVENTETFTGTERRSDYGQLIQSVKNNYINKNIGALILFGDGIYNQGQNPENFASGLKFPVYTIGVGDTARKTDAVIGNVKTNKVAFLKNKFPVEIELKFSKLKNKMAYIDIENNHQQIYSSTISIVSDDDFKLELASLEATHAGLQHYKIRIRPFDGEVNLKNNEFEFVIQILENKQKILLLSDGPHPDMGAIRNSLSELQNYETKLVTGNEIPDSLSSYNLIILNQIPALKNAASKLLTRIKESRIPVLFLVGPNSLLEQLNSLDMGLKISASKNTEEVQAKFDDNFSLFVLSSGTKEILAGSPPLLSPFGNTELSPMMQNLAFQYIRNIQTNKTMMAFGTNKGRKTGFVLGEGLWRWRLYDFQKSGNHEAFNEWIQKTIQYLALRENEDNFNVYHPALFQETDNIELTAELYNDSYELVNTPDVTIRIQNDSLKEFNYLFDRTNDSYNLNAGNMEPGDYTFEAETQLGNQHFTEKGTFSIVKNELEVQNNRADFGVLVQLSQQTGGQFYPIARQDSLLEAIRDNKQITVQEHQQTTQNEWINLKGLFLMLIILLGVEWFFRKYWGIY
ncbi:MAG TPA: hypothetical protein VFC65_15655 [Prolixibacteraceae bacterium]|nr:hypothetical protein [Prolixibacteraceae bacterium]